MIPEARQRFMITKIHPLAKRYVLAVDSVARAAPADCQFGRLSSLTDKKLQ